MLVASQPPAPEPRPSLIDRWIPQEFRASPAHRIRAQVGLLFPLYYVLFVLLEATFYLANGAGWTALCLLLTIPAMAFAPCLLITTRSFVWNAHVSGAVFVALIVSASVVSGGTDWRSLVWIAPAALYLLLVGGPRPATVWLLVGLASTVGLYAAKGAGFPFPGTDAPQPPSLELMEILALSAATFTLAYVYHRVNTAVVTELDRASAALAHIRESLDDAQRLACVGSWELDFRTLELTWSEGQHALFQRAPGTPVTVEEAMGYIHPEDRPRFEELYERMAAAALDRGTIDCRIVRPDGTMRVLHWIFSAVCDGDGVMTGFTGTAQDVTEARAANAELVRAREQALFASAAKSQFLSHMSHEIRTPMNGVIGMTSLALGTNLDAEQREYIESARSAGLHLLTIIGDILDLTKVEAGELVVEHVPFSLARTMGEVADTIGYGAREKGVAVVLDIDASLPGAFSGDPVRVRQILLNLAGNAVKFTSAGTITLRAGPDPARADAVRVVVEDTGVGIPLEAQARIFDSFQQADGSTTRRFGGTGLGLTISRKLAELMGGRLWVESAPGAGSRFHLQLPLAVADVADLAPPHSPAREPRAAEPAEDEVGSPLVVLLAEDCALNARVATRLLGKAGHRVIHVENGREAVRVALAEPIDLVLMDLQMPELDGIEATRLIRSHEADDGGHLPIVALTANAMKGDDADCLAAGMDAYLSKPLDPGQLLAAVRAIALKRGGRQAPRV